MFTVGNIDLYDFEDSDFDTILESNITFKGNIRFTKPLMIRGQVSGIIDATGDLVVDTNASVDSMITAARVLIRGKVTGDIDGKKLVLVTSTGSVTGNISSAQIVLEPGSTFSGKCTTVAE